ncbi:RHS repeat-associated core domain-containing protein, partial [Sulfuritalea sp.]|uniref:RHS repeat-associated core domain-containing protein n=1 Tax=Sulfuritalea sp. TaxID=2480090 RepID=UPI00286E5DBD
MKFTTTTSATGRRFGRAVRALLIACIGVCALGLNPVYADKDKHDDRRENREQKRDDHDEARGEAIVVFGPKTYTRGNGGPDVYRESIAIPAGVAGPWKLRLENGDEDRHGRHGNRVSSGSLHIDGVEVLGPNDFNRDDYVIEKRVDLTPASQFELRLAGKPGGRVTLSFLGVEQKPIPVAIDPRKLSLAPDATGTMLVRLAPTPNLAGTLAVRSSETRVARVPSTVSFAAGQASVSVSVEARASGRSEIRASLNGHSVEGKVQVTRKTISITSLTPAQLDLVRGSNGTLTIELSAASRRAVTVGLQSSDTAVASLPGSVSIPAGSNRAEFAVAALGYGNAQITARLSDKSGDSLAVSQIRVVPPAAQVVSLLPVTGTLTLGAHTDLQLTLSAAQSASTTVPLVTTPTGILDVPSQVVIPAGQLSAPVPVGAITLGTAGITASLNGSSVSSVLLVLPPAPAVTALTPPTLTLRQDATGSLTVKLNAAQLTATEVALVAADPAIVQIAPTAIVPAGETSVVVGATGLTLGASAVTASVNGTSQSANVTVIPHAPVPVSLLPDPLPLQQGAAGQLTLAINAAQFEDVPVTVTNATPAILQVPAQIVVPAGATSAPLPVTALAPGEGSLSVTIDTTSLAGHVVVTPPPPAVSTLSPTTLSLPKGVPGRLQLTLTRAPADTAQVVLASSDPNVAEVSASVTVPAGALIAEFPLTSRAQGVATITASLNGGTASSQVTVTAPELVALTLSPQTPLAYIGETVAFIAQGAYTDASQQDITNSVTWTSDAPAVASIASTGVATALAAGAAGIKAVQGSVSATTQMQVESVPVLSLHFADGAATASLKVDAALTLTVSSSVAAEADGLAVSLTVGGSGGIVAPASVLIPAGQTSASFSVTGSTRGEVVITASAPRRVAAAAILQILPKILITALSPSTGPVGSPVTITGESFDPTAANNEVRFNGERAVVGSASATTLQVIVPVRATSGPVTVTTPAGSATSPTPFTVQLQQDFDLTLSPATLQAPPGGVSTTRIHLDSRGLLPYAYAATLSVAGLPAGITAKFERPTVFANGESGLQLTVPAGFAAGTYPITVQATGATELGNVTRGKTLNVEVLAAGTTSVSGRVLHAGDDQPFVGARIRLGMQETQTDASGYYRFLAPTVLGSQIVLIDGHTANTETTRYASAIAMPVQITAGQDNLVLTSYMSPVDATKQVTIVPGTQASVTMPDLPNYSLNIPAGATLYGWDGTPVTQINVRTIPVDRLPIKPLPAGVETRSVYLYYFFREGGANPTQPIPVTMVNDLDAPPGEKITLWYYDESVTADSSSNQWKVMGLGTVSADGKSIVSDPGVGIPKFCCGASFAQRNPTTQSAAATGPTGGNGDASGVGSLPDLEIGESSDKPGLKQPKSDCPVDLATGNNLPLQMRGFGIKALVPAKLNCQYRSTDPRIGLFGRGTSSTYDWTAPQLGNTVQVTTPDGIKYSLAREADGVYRAQTGKSGALGWEVRSTASGRTLRLPHGGEMDFNANGLVQAMRNAEGNSIRFGYDGNGFLNSITDSNGRGYAITTTQYVSGQRYPLITSITDALGRVVRYTYDGSGRLATHTDSGGNVTSYLYDTSNRVTRRTLPTGGAINFEYDAAGRTTREVLEDGTAAIGYAYQTVGSLVTQTTVTDPLGRKTEYRFNGQGYVTRITDATGRATSQTLDPATNLVQSITDPVGRITRYTYDTKGKVTQVTDPLGNVTRIEYDPTWNKPSKITDALGNVTTLTYGTKGRLIQSTDPTGAVRSIAYTPQGLPSTLTDPLGRISSLAWDGEGNLVAATDPLGNTSRRRYDEANRLIETTDALGHSQTLTPDVMDRVTQATDANGGITTLAYDALDRLTSLTDPRGNPVERRSYNLRGQLTQRLDAANRATSYEYDAAGNLTKITDRKGQATTLGYDALNRPIDVRTADGRITSTDYDLAGNVAAIRDSQSGDLLFAYDTLDRPIRVVSDQGSVEYEYDALGRRTRRTINGGDPTSYSYDAASRLTRIDYRGRNTTYSYDAAGRLTSKTLPNGMKQRYSFDDADRVLEVRIERNDGSALDTVGYAYDAAGRRTRRDATVAGIPETPIDATYDQSNRLISLSIDGQSHTVAYDLNGNLTTKTAANGAITTYTWDAANRLTGITAPNLTASFRYDALGRRIEKTVNGETVQYLYDGQQAIAEIRGSAISATLLTGLAIDEAIARYTDQGERTLLTDALGSVILAAKEDGSVATAYGYSPYGETQVMGTEEGNATQYTGRENDGMGLFYYRARYYDAQLKQWMSEDPIGISGGRNVYRYVNGNPISYTDPDGLR